MNRVCALILTSGRRPEFLAKAIECALMQTYEAVDVLVVDSSKDGCAVPPVLGIHPRVRTVCYQDRPTTVGGLRNFGIEMCTAEYLAHFDDDDWSDPLRIEEQVSALETHHADLVGYRSMLVWDAVKREAWQYTGQHPKACIGASLLYRRSFWAERPFARVQTGEDSRMLLPWANSPRVHSMDGGQYRMICRVHGANTGMRIPATRKPEWTRTKEIDLWCRTVMGGTTR